jgi:tRNA threonylcarbamoyladenosine biosynthesis protein TsaB
LAFDTSAAHCAAALLCGDRVILRDEAMAKGQAERLMPLLEEMLAEVGIGWADLCAIGVGTGPGNFTGVRISVAAARGLALGLGVPAIGVTALEAMAFGAARPVTVMIDARRDEVYVQSFGEDGSGVAHLAARDMTRRDVVGLGGVAPQFALAEAIARITAQRFADPHPRPAPFYLRGADAAPSSDPAPVILPCRRRLWQRCMRGVSPRPGLGRRRNLRQF